MSVRSHVEARSAVAGGAAVVDVKEPSRGPLGRADCSVWRQVRDAVPARLPVSVALGEIGEWIGPAPADLSSPCCAGIGYFKLGLAGAPSDWPDRFRAIRVRLGEPAPGSAGWVAVVYADWEQARAPHPDLILEYALALDECGGVLFDTSDKTRGAMLNETWAGRIGLVRASGRLVALAGSLDSQAIARLAKLDPDYFAVRGAACLNGDRLATIDSERVARLVEAASGSACNPR